MGQIIMEMKIMIDIKYLTIITLLKAVVMLV